MAHALLFILALTLGPTQSYAKKVTIFGAGNVSCGQWTAEIHDSAARHLLTNWVLGFISGVNWASSSDQSAPPDAAAAVAFTDQYCRNNPLHPLVNAATALVSEMGGPKAVHDWKR